MAAQNAHGDNAQFLEDVMVRHSPPGHHPAAEALLLRHVRLCADLPQVRYFPPGNPAETELFPNEFSDAAAAAGQQGQADESVAAGG